jgi:soluble lytic murein transglycosylase
MKSNDPCTLWLARRLGDARTLATVASMAACGFIACAFPSPAAAAPTDAEAHDAAVREQFRAAYAAPDVGIEANDDDALRAYVLYPYLRAARIARALARAEGAWHETDVATAEFLAETGQAPVAQALRRAWLASLARRESWQAFLEHYDGSAATASLECQHFNARIARHETAGLAAAIRPRWLAGYRLPSECEPAFQWLRAQRELPDELVAERTKLLLDNGQASFARVIAARLPPKTAAPLLERADFIESPARMLDALLRDPDRAAPPEVVLEAWSRLARNAPEEALARFAALSGRVTSPEEAHELPLALAMGLAWDRRPEALDYFARVPRAALDDSSREWQARAAMWAGDWDLVRATIAAMSTAHQSEWAWRYWAARAAEQLDEGDVARALYTATLDGDNYYSAMAAARLGERVTPRLEPLPLDAAKVESIAAMGAFRRVRELFLVDLRELATNEWHFGYAMLPEGQRLQAVHLAARLGIYDIAVTLATSHGQFNDYTLLYPRPYGDEVAAAVKLTDVEPHLLYGVLRQESLFRPDAASSAGALGVAQLTHATARETARRWQLPAPQRADLFDPAVNITLGAARIAELLERFDAQLPVALGAYNAGASAAARWLPPHATASDIWIENIPYNETRAYVRRVLWHSLVFRWLETGRPQSARDWVGRIDPR